MPGLPPCMNLTLTHSATKRAGGKAKQHVRQHAENTGKRRIREARVKLPLGVVDAQLIAPYSKPTQCNTSPALHKHV
jgi:hypothetical protein